MRRPLQKKVIGGGVFWHDGFHWVLLAQQTGQLTGHTPPLGPSVAPTGGSPDEDTGNPLRGPKRQDWLLSQLQMPTKGVEHKPVDESGNCSHCEFEDPLGSRAAYSVT